MKIGIFTSFDDKHLLIVEACKHIGVDYEVIDYLRSGWIERVQNSGCDGFIVHPASDIQEWKTLSDERLYFVEQVLKKPLYPTFQELYIYESKRNMSYWLKAHDFPHAQTRVFARYKDAREYILSAPLPMVFKTNIGAGASGVDIVRNRKKALRIARRVFGRFHPALTLGRLRFSRKFHGIPLPLLGRIQKHYLIVQEFLDVKWEWRMIKIGDSYMGHKKLMQGDFASGSLQTELVQPPLELLHMLKDLCDKGGFYSMDMDVLETRDGQFFINELQTVFGSYSPIQMRVDGQPGRFLYNEGNFEFEQGVFNEFGSNLLRVKHFIEILKKQQRG